jgi:hypothetical protein
MLNPIKKELERLAHEILAQKDTANATVLLQQVQQLYKQLILLEHLEGQAKVQQEQPAEVPPLMDTINELVTELPLEEESAAIDDLFASVAEPVFVKKEAEVQQEPIATPSQEAEAPRNLNDVLGKGIQIGLNDRLAFIKNLFDGSAEDFQRVISQVQTLGSWDEAHLFIENMIKPDYNHWEGKEAFELRFLKCLESNF